MYLNDVARGGGTRFPRLGITCRPRKGCALIFFPSYIDGGLDPKALHEALPAVDRKYVCQVWVHDQELPLVDEERNAMGHRLLAALHDS